jgi:hypothetical protein
MNSFIDILLSNVIFATKYIYYIHSFIYIDFFNLTAFKKFLSRERKERKTKKKPVWCKSWRFNELHYM